MPSSLRKFRLANARRLRANATLAEQRLWKTLRRFPVYGTHFRRQVALGPFVADFACQRAKLVIEVDGSQHARDGAITRDTARTRWLENEGYNEGYKVLRFWNSNISGNLEGVLELIYATLYGAAHAELKTFDHPTPATSGRRPSPSRGGWEQASTALDRPHVRRR